MNFKEIKDKALADFNVKKERLTDYLMKPASKYKGDGILEQLPESAVWSERDRLVDNEIRLV